MLWLFIFIYICICLKVKGFKFFYDAHMPSTFLLLYIFCFKVKWELFMSGVNFFYSDMNASIKKLIHHSSKIFFNVINFLYIKTKQQKVNYHLIY